VVNVPTAPTGRHVGSPDEIRGINGRSCIPNPRGVTFLLNSDMQYKCPPVGGRDDDSSNAAGLIKIEEIASASPRKF
jgi:hypothetical protein